MTDIKGILSDQLITERFKDFVLELERENLGNIDKENKKQMVSKIIRNYEEAKKSDNKFC